MSSVKNKILRVLVRSVGRLSDGIRMSLDIGLTSGKMLDYIYRNKSSGRFLLGKLLDRLYLSHKGWKVIRTRKNNLEILLTKALEDLLSRRNKALVLDIASGPARYVFETAGEFPRDRVDWLCREYDPRWVEEGNQKALETQAGNIRFEQGDAFDPQSFQGLTPQVVISSGFYDWIKDDDKVRTSLRLVSGVLEPGGWFVTTIQSGHVGLDMVSEVFVDFNQKPLDMKVFDPQEFQGWLEAEGLVIRERKADQFGHYTVFLAQKK